MKQNTAQARVIATVVYLLVLLVVQWTIVGTGFPLDQKALWFFNGVASLLLGSRLLNPHFVPPADVATNAFFASATLATAFAVSAPSTDKAIIIIAISFCVALLALSLGVILIRRDPRLETRRWVDTAQRVIRGLGSPRVIFTGVILVLTWVFHRESSLEVFAILVTWTLIVALDPVEALIDLLHRITAEVKSVDRTIMGEIVAFQHPGLVLIRQQDDTRYPTGTLMALSDTHGPARLGVSLNYVGRDEGVLLRTLSLDVPPKIKQRVDEVSINAAVAVKLEVDDEDKSEVQVLDRVNRLCGIVDSDTTTGFLEVEIINDADLFEGRLVDVKIRSDTVIYQVIDGVTREEFVQQKNKYGFARAKARKIGKWDGTKGKFKQVSWLPALNAPVFLKEPETQAVNRAAIGHFPDTTYHVELDVSQAVTHNTAILGILGVGKSYLAIEFVERMLSDSIRVLCLDLTDQYADLLEPFYDKEMHSKALDFLHKAADGRPPGTRETGGSVHKFRKAVRKVLETFLDPEKEYGLLVLNPASFIVSKQTSGFKPEDAGFSDLTPAEITAIFSDEALAVCQSFGMTDKARACLVYEEAHTLVPEWNSVAADGDKHATAASARAILQGRKFGLGCLLITQRTANVTKTILNQCNTIFAMRTFDDTGKEFLSNYIGSEYARVLPALKDRHAVFFGKSSSCDDPVLIRLNDRDSFLKSFRKSEDKDPVAEAD